MCELIHQTNVQKTELFFRRTFCYHSSMGFYYHRPSLFLCLTSVLFMGECAPAVYYQPLKPDPSNRIWQAIQACPPAQPGQIAFKPKPTCIEAVLTALPLDPSSFHSSKEGQAASKKLAKTLAWLLSLPPLEFPPDNTILGQTALTIPEKYLCILTPEKNPKACLFQPEFEGSITPTINQRLFHYFLTSVTSFIYETDHVDNPQKIGVALAFAIRNQDKREIHLLPPFWDRSESMALANLFHETQHFYPNSRHIYCSEYKYQPDKIKNKSCDEGPFTGPFGANLVLDELLRQTLGKQISFLQKQQPELSIFQAEDQICDSSLCAAYLFENTCYIYFSLNHPFPLPPEAQSLCQTRQKDQIAFHLEFAQKKESFIQKYPNIFVPIQTTLQKP